MSGVSPEGVRADGRLTTPAWWPVAVLAGLVAVAVGLFFETARSLVNVWASSATYGHGFLILPIAGYLAYARRERLGCCPKAPSLVGVAIVVGAALVWMAGEIADLNLFKHLGLVVVLQGLVVSVLGTAAAWVLLFPLSYLLLAVPFGDFMVEPLQWLTAQYTAELVGMTGVPVHLDGWFMTIPGGTFHVAEACAGVRYLLACLAFGLLVCEFFFRRAWKIGAYMALAVAVPVVANVLRAYGIVMLAHLSDFEIAVGVDHLIYGYIFLSLVTVILIAIGLVMRDQAAQPGAAGAVKPPAATGSPARGARSVVVLLLLVSLVGIRGYAHAVAPPSEAAGEVDLEAPNTTGTGWGPVAGSTLTWQPQFTAADAEAMWGFVRGESRVDVFLAHYRFERPGAELIAGDNHLADLDRSEIMARGIAAASPYPGWPEPGYARVAGNRGDLLVWYWYVVDGTVVNRPYRAKLERILAQFGGPVASSVVAVATEAGPEAPARLTRFLGEIDVARSLPGLKAAPR